MSLNFAHEGYDYQDLLAAYFILDEVINERNATIKIDKKEFDNDKFDDITIINNKGRFKKQIKYSNSDNDHALEKDDIASEKYDLALDVLFDSWKLVQGDDLQEVRLCLSWNDATDNILEILDVDSGQSIPNFPTKSYKINPSALWPINDTIKSTWRRFSSKSKMIDRNDFVSFCNDLLIEVEFPKFSQDVYNPGDLENIVIKQLAMLGAGEFPNDRLTPENTLLYLLQSIRRSRSTETDVIHSNKILSSLGFQTDFGAISQIFPVDEKLNVVSQSFLEVTLTNVLDNSISILTAEPGAGKSWFTTTLQRVAQERDIHVVRHYCYTDLQDQFATERITLNTFYGNLIGELMNEFPQLKDYKFQRYASNLTELNLLLQNVTEKTIIFIDGLDHINRVYELNGRDLAPAEIEIVNKLNDLKLSENVSLVVSSQPIAEIESITSVNRLTLPGWTSEQVTDLMNRYSLKDSVMEDNITLSQHLLEKSNGNSLYLTYLIKEINQIDNFSKNDFHALPSYSNNLTEYYEYLLLKLPAKSEIPRILSGCNFRLSNDDLKQITGIGNLVDQQLEAIKPILRSNLSQGGHILYHESFRRFIIEELKKNQIEIKNAVLKPVIDWLSQKDYFSFQKSYRFLFPMSYDYGNYEIISQFIDESFLYESIYYGNSLESVKRNYHYMALAVTKLKLFPQLISLNEINRIIKTTEDEFYDQFESYVEALGYVHGFNKISEFLIFEGLSTVNDFQGWSACYTASRNGTILPWDSFIDLDSFEEFEINEFKYVVRYCIDLKNYDRLEQFKQDLIRDNLKKYIHILVRELSFNKNSDERIGEIYSEIIDFENSKERQNIIELANAFLERRDRHLSDEQERILETIIQQIRLHVLDQNHNAISHLCSLFSEDTWFYNWLQFVIEIELINQNHSERSIIQAFELLRKNMDPFAGNPQAAWLYKTRTQIHLSIIHGIEMINSEHEWEQVIEILCEVSNRTTTYLQGSPGGPLVTDVLFEILLKYSPKNVTSKIIEKLEPVLSKVEEYHFHSHLAENHFDIAKLYARKENQEKASFHFMKGIEFMFGYTFRKDITLEELIESIESVITLSKVDSLKELKNLKTLVDSVVDHTDGKETRHFPESWFTKFLSIDPDNALLYTVNSMVKINYNWVYESNIRKLLINLNGRYPDLEFLIASTFILETDSEFVRYRLSLFEKISPELKDYANSELHHLFEILKNKNLKSSGDCKSELSEVAQRLKIDGYHYSGKQTDIRSKKDDLVPIIDFVQENYSFRRDLQEMSDSEVLQYIDEYGISDKEQMSFYYYFKSQSELSEVIKEQISILATHNQRYSEHKSRSYDELFEPGSQLYSFYWIKRFILDRGDWFEGLTNPEAFNRIYSEKPNEALDYFFEEIFDGLTGKYFQRRLSGNLLNTLISANYDELTTLEMWKRLKRAISKRLPNQVEDEWNLLLSNQFNMVEEELLFSILITRLQSGSLERFSRTLLGIRHVIQNYPKIVLKPLKWFFYNSNHFLKTSFQSILQIIDESNSADEIMQDLELKQLIFRNYNYQSFSIDLILRKYYNDIAFKTNLQNTLETSLSDDQIRFFASLNFKYFILRTMYIDSKNAIIEGWNLLQKNRENDFELFKSNSARDYARNIYHTEYFNSALNNVLYDELANPWMEDAFYEVLKLHIDFVVSNRKSLISRPDYIELSQKKPGMEIQEVNTTNEWVKIAHFESQRLIDRGEKTEVYYTSYGGIGMSQPDIIPYTDYPIYPMSLYDSIPIAEPGSMIISSLIQRWEGLERFIFLWPDIMMLKGLDINPPQRYEKLCGTNVDNEVVLKFERWQSDYGYIYMGNLNEEIFDVEGCHLLIRRDYLHKLIAILDSNLIYYEFNKEE